MINFTIRLSGQIPSGKNAVKITRTGKRYPCERFKIWRDEAMTEMMRQLRPRPSTNKPVTMIVDYVPSDARRRDLPGMLDALCHLLEKAGILLDDAQVKQCVWKTFDPDKENAGCKLTVMA